MRAEQVLPGSEGSGGREKGWGAGVNMAQTMYTLTNNELKKGWWSGSRCRPEFKPQYQERKS
jgi:hypothetical protein